MLTKAMFKRDITTLGSLIDLDKEFRSMRVTQQRFSEGSGFSARKLSVHVYTPFFVLLF